jgi:hypothetical protein
LLTSFKPIQIKVHKGWSWSIIAAQNDGNQVLYWIEAVKGLELKTIPVKISNSNPRNYSDEEIAILAMDVWGLS